MQKWVWKGGNKRSCRNWRWITSHMLQAHVDTLCKTRPLAWGNIIHSPDSAFGYMALGQSDQTGVTEMVRADGMEIEKESRAERGSVAEELECGLPCKSGFCLHMWLCSSFSICPSPPLLSLPTRCCVSFPTILSPLQSVPHSFGPYSVHAATFKNCSFWQPIVSG